MWIKAKGGFSVNMDTIVFYEVKKIDDRELDNPDNKDTYQVVGDCLLDTLLIAFHYGTKEECDLYKARLDSMMSVREVDPLLTLELEPKL